MHRLRSIQYLRALAALAVVLYHAGQWSDAGFAIGAAGVDLFFVISGFVMWLAVQDRGLRPAQFLRRRLWRITPPYWLLTALTAALAFLWPKLLPHVYLSASHLALSLLFIPHTDPADLPFPLLPVGWSLTYEMVFYLVVAGALTQPLRLRFGRLGWGLAGVMLLGVIVRPAYFLFANPMMLQFLAGAAIAKAYLERRLPRHCAGWGLLVAAAALFSILSWFDLYSSLWRPVLWGAPAALTVAGAVSLEAQGFAWRSRLLAMLGEASYSIYLCHWPVVVMLSRVAGLRQPWLFVPLATTASIGIGLLFWRFVERPLLRWSRPAVTTAAMAAAPLA